MGILFWALLRSIIFSCIGNSFYKWFSKTRMGIWFDKKLDRMLSTIVRKHNVARSNNKRQVDMFKTEEYYNKSEPRFNIPRRTDGGPSK